ncbi:MAG: glycosyltransferase family 32 protein [Candidatus Babeliales bacterium]
MKFNKKKQTAFFLFFCTLISANSKKQQQIPSFDRAMVCHSIDEQTYKNLVTKRHPAAIPFEFFRQQYQEHIVSNKEDYQRIRIPKIIHQIWIGPKPFPEHCKKWQKSWLKLNPDWEYKLWTNEDLKNITLINQKYYDLELNWGAKSDILRYEILEQFGGLYVDIDFECIKPFDWLHHYCDFYAGLLEIKRLKNKARLANGIIACSPHHPLMQKIIEELPNYRNNSNLLDRVGPDFFTSVVHTYMPECPGINIIFPSNFFFSWSNKILIQPETMAIHYYAGTWH